MGNQSKNTSSKQDRRAIRSKRMIMEAWRELILEKDYKKISVNDIVKRADIGRATFYAHFDDKEALSRFMFSQLLAQIESEIQAILDENEAQENTYQNLVPSLALFRIAEEKHRWFKMNGTNPTTGLTMLVHPLVKRLETKLNEMNLSTSDHELPTHISALYLVSGLISILTDWVMDDMPVPPEEMDEMYQALAEPTLKRLMGE